ncbi:hypothetical protein OAF83_02030 [Rubripirellula sp.]|nr:hypothetical protein [Rubripirellula sp.]MDB4749661.1 hypothetical protein [Rubripirellula sp.]
MSLIYIFSWKILGKGFVFVRVHFTAFPYGCWCLLLGEVDAHCVDAHCVDAHCVDAHCVDAHCVDAHCVDVSFVIP